MKIIETHNQDDSGTSKDVGRRNINIKDSWIFYFFILLSLATQLPDWIPYLKHKIKLMDAKSYAERGNISAAKKNVFYVLDNSKNKNVIAEAMYLVGRKREIDRDGRFIAYASGTVLDMKTGLMWASKDNGKNINWQDAKRYCENYRDGDYSDWRMPTQDELAGIYEPNTKNTNPKTEGCDTSGNHINRLFHITCCCLWAPETRGSDAAYFAFFDGSRHLFPPDRYRNLRVLPVRSDK